MAYAHTVAVDMDGTIAAWERGDGTEFGAAAGAWLPGSQEFIRELLGVGLKVVVHTCRATWELGGGTPAVEAFVASGVFAPASLSDLRGFPGVGEHGEFPPITRERHPAVKMFVPRLVVGQEMEGLHADDLDSAAGEVGVWVGVGKPIASAYVDDRGVPIDPVRNGYGTALKWVLELCGMGADVLESAVRT